jgi:hypothetical protein
MTTTNSTVSYFSITKKAQLKVQQMAFVLVAIVIFFSLVALIYFTISLTSLQKDAQVLREQEAKKLVRKMSSSPELILTSQGDCSSCIDFDKAFMLSKSRPQFPNYAKNLLNLDYLVIERIYPEPTIELCTFENKNCRELVIINDENYGAAESAFVTLGTWDSTRKDYKYELGIIHLSIRDPK